MKLINMKKYIYILICILIAGLTACNEENYSEKENYKYVVYLLSKENYNVYSEVYALNDGNEVTGYFSVGCGGSLSNPEEIIVNLEPDTILLKNYNKSNFDIDVSKYARLLPASKYRIETNQVIFPAANKDHYVKVAVTVKPDGLSPDSTYFVPVAIKSVSRYEVNPEKYSLLFRVALQNYYAEQLTSTYYQLKGTVLDPITGDAIGTLSSTKLARPLTKNSIRIYAGNEVQTASSTVADIKKYSVVLTVDANKKVQITPYGSIQVEQLDGGGAWNTYEEAKVNAADLAVNKYFYLYYRFRTVKTDATPTQPAVYNNWIIAKETLKRLE
jgi:hypothetical protein